MHASWHDAPRSRNHLHSTARDLQSQHCRLYTLNFCVDFGRTHACKVVDGCCAPTTLPRCLARHAAAAFLLLHPSRATAHTPHNCLATCAASHSDHQQQRLPDLDPSKAVSTPIHAPSLSPHRCSSFRCHGAVCCCRCYSHGRHADTIPGPVSPLVATLHAPLLVAPPAPPGAAEGALPARHGLLQGGKCEAQHSTLQRRIHTSQNSY